jgi:hypothetical protein
MYLSVRILRWLLAAILIYAFFFKEDADRKLQSRVETWWLRLAYGQDAAFSKATAFLRVLARLTGTVFDRLFGRRLFSFRGLGVSVCYSIASFFLCIQLVVGLSPKSPGPTSLEVWLLFCLFFLLGSTPAVLRRSDDEPLWLWGLAVVAIVFIPLFKFMDFLRQSNQAISATGFAVFLAVIFVISSGSDFCYIALTRWMLRKAAELKHWIGILGIVVLDCLLGLLLFLGPIFFGGLVALKLNPNIVTAATANPHVVPKIAHPSPGTMIAVGVMLGGPALNTIDFLACSLFFVLMAIMLLHRLLWPILEGPIYVFQRFGLIKRKGWLLAAAVGLLFGKTILSVLIELLEKL